MGRDPAEPAPPRHEPRSRLTRKRAAIVAGSGAFVAMVVYWALIFTGSLTPHNPDRLPDRAWAERSDAICKPVVDAIDKLPNAGHARDATERADTLDRGTEMLRPMVDALAANQPNTADGRRTLAAWIADWHVYLADRQAYGENLRRIGGKAKPLFTEVHGSTAKQTITDFADANSMQDCEPPEDF